MVESGRIAEIATCYMFFVKTVEMQLVLATDDRLQTLVKMKTCSQ